MGFSFENLLNQSSSNVDLASLEARQESILRRLEDLKIQVETLTGSKISKVIFLYKEINYLHLAFRSVFNFF